MSPPSRTVWTPDLSLPKTRSCEVLASTRRQASEQKRISGLGLPLCLARQPAARSPLAVPRGFPAAGAIFASPHLRVEGNGDVSVVCGSGGYPLVVPIQAAGPAVLNDLADLRRLYGPVLRAVHLSETGGSARGDSGRSNR